jgi:serine/threonine protein phosphatase PrpC
MLVGFKASAQGASHKEIDKPCQDNALCFVTPEKTVGIAVAADGHGGEKYLRSQIGSKKAAAITKNAVSAFFGNMAKTLNKETNNSVEKEKIIESALRVLESNIIYTWRKAVSAHLKKHPLDEKEQAFCEKHHFAAAIDDKAATLYGTTLIAALVSETCWFAIQIGDGLCVTLDEEGKTAVAIPEDERLAFGRTTSLCDSNAIGNFRHRFGFGKIQGITVCTDGVADSFEPDKYLAFNQKLQKEFLSTPATAEADLQKFLPELSERGSRDDVAIAGVFRTEA